VRRRGIEAVKLNIDFIGDIVSGHENIMILWPGQCPVFFDFSQSGPSIRLLAYSMGGVYNNGMFKGKACINLFEPQFLCIM